MAIPKVLHQLAGSVLKITETKGSIFCIDNTMTITEINDFLQVDKSLQISKNLQSPHRYSHAFGISYNFFFCVPIIGQHKVFILKYELGKLSRLLEIDDHDGEIESCAFSNDGKYFATGGQDGRVFLYDGSTFSPLTGLMARSDYISVITFSKNNEYVAISGFDKFTMIFDLLRYKIAFNFVTNDVVEASHFFENDEKLILVCRNHASIIFSLRDGKVLSQEYPFAFWPTSIAVDTKENYALVGTRSEVVYVMALKDNTKAMEIKQEHSGVSTLSFCKDYLYVGCIDGAVLIVDYNEGREELEVAFEKKDYHLARKVIDENIFLTIHPLTKVFDEVWPEILNEAIELLKDDKIEEAIELTAPFVVHEKKKNEFDFYLGQKDSVKNFLNCINSKDYTKAYDMLKMIKFLSKTQAYEKLESIWNKSFAMAKKLLIENATINQRLAEQYLAPFENTPKKELITQLLRNADSFAKADNFIKMQNFKDYFSLTFQFSFLRDTDLYKKVLIVGDKMFANLIDLEKQGRYEEAKKIAETLLVFPNLKRSANERIVLIQQKEALLSAIERRDISKVYTLVDEVEILRTMLEFKEFTKDFLGHYEEARVYASFGNATHIMALLDEYMKLNYWQDKIASLFKIAYLKQISNALDAQDVNWQITIKRYFERYGKSIEIVKMLKNHPAKEVLDTFEGEGDADGYRYNGFVENIVIYFVQKDV